MRTGIKGILFDLDNTLIDRQAAADAKIRKLVDALFPQLREEPVERENVVQKLLTWDEYGLDRENPHVLDAGKGIRLKPGTGRRIVQGLV